MATNSLIPFSGARRRTLQALALVLAAGVVGFGHGKTYPSYEFDQDDGRDVAAQVTDMPTVEAAFPRQSYGPSSTARLVITDRATHVSIQIRRVGPESGPIWGNYTMTGVPMTGKHLIGRVAGRRVVKVRLGDWPSGVYFAELTAPRGRIGYAPFVLRPRHLGVNRVAVVMPTQTWQAYNHRDDDGDGTADTWYACSCKHTARLGRPFLDRGTPPHFKHYEAWWLRWLVHTHKAVDIISDAELNHVRSGRDLAHAYSLLIFSGHHEYVTDHEYDVVKEYRDRGGNLIFLSANNFFWKIVIRGHVMTRIAQWRDLGRPESSLLGVQYFHNDGGQHRGSWIVRAAGFDWLFDGTGLRNGSQLSNGGIEADRMTSASPKSTKIVAEIPNLYGRGMTAQMTYYETKAGAKVFAAGAFTLAGSVRTDQHVQQLIDNLWARLGNDARGS